MAVQVAVVAADVACLLRRFVLQQSFSSDTGGGGRASNARRLFVLLQLGRHMLSSASADALQPLTAAMAELSESSYIQDGKVGNPSTKRPPFRCLL